MRTIETMALVTHEGELILRLQLPSTFVPGQHRVVLVIEETPTQTDDSSAPLQLEAFAWPGWPAEATFRREDLYDADGR
jgi:hypothetical protein